MTRLPASLQPLWPAAKVTHRAATRTVGRVTRRTVRGDRGVPSGAYTTSAEAAAAEPDNVTIHRTTMGEQKSRSLPVGDPTDMRFWHDVLDLNSPDRSVLDINGGQLVGDYAATITPAGLIDLQTSPYFGIRDWREHPIYLRGRLPHATQISGAVLSLASHASSRNYYHSLMDTAPRWGLFAETLTDLKPDHIVIAHQSRWDRQIVELLGLTNYSLIEPIKHLSIRAERLLVPSLTNQDTRAPSWITRWLRENLPAKRVVDRPKRLYVTRGNQPNTRRFVREAELLTILEPLGFERFDPGEVSVQEQIDTFAAAEIVVAPHGAGLVNLNFAPAGVKVLELFAPRYLNPGYWAIVDNIPGSVYRYLVADPVKPDRPERKMNRVQTDIDIDPTRVLRAVKELLVS